MSGYLAMRLGSGSAISDAPTMMTSTPCCARSPITVSASAAWMLSTTMGSAKPFAVEISLAASTTAW